VSEDLVLGVIIGFCGALWLAGYLLHWKLQEAAEDGEEYGRRMEWKGVLYDVRRSDEP